MAEPFIKLEKPILDFSTRQVPVFEEVIENFEVKCCEEHHPQRQKMAEKAKRALQLLKSSWEEKETSENEQLRTYAESMGVSIEEVQCCKNNISYHRFALVLSQWCVRLSELQAEFQAAHTHQLLTMRMPPGSHEVSDRQLKMNFRSAMLSYMVLNTFDPSLPRMSPLYIMFITQIVNSSRTESNPAVYHMASYFIERVVRDANRQLLQHSL
ncbi:unnamed protein product [Caenorhabditis brenneri]